MNHYEGDDRMLDRCIKRWASTLTIIALYVLVFVLLARA